MRQFLNSPKNGLFAGGIIFALGLHLGSEKCDLKKCPISRSRQIFSCKNTSFCCEICRCCQIYRQICQRFWGWVLRQGGLWVSKKAQKYCVGGITMGAARRFMASIGGRFKSQLPVNYRPPQVCMGGKIAGLPPWRPFFDPPPWRAFQTPPQASRCSRAKGPIRVPSK